MKERLLAPDFIKGICIILMVYGHITSIGSSISIQNSITDIIYTFHMPLFLIVSGFFFHVLDEYKIQIVKLIKNIGIPYLIFISLYLIALIFIKHFDIKTNNQPPETIFGFLKTILLKPYGAYWFIHSLFFLNLTFIVVNLIYKIKDNLFYFLLSTLVILIIFSYLDFISFKTSFYFIIGFLINLLFKGKLEMHLIPSLIFVILSSLVGYFYQTDFFNLSGLSFIWCISLFTFFCSFAQKFNKNLFVNIIGWVGKNTLIILLLHALFITLFKPLTTIFLQIDHSGILYSICVTFFTLIFSILSSKIFDILSLSKYVFGTDKIYKNIHGY